MIKKPINFVFGISCLIFTVIDILVGKDAFITIIALIAAIVNLVIAFIEED